MHSVKLNQLIENNIVSMELKEAIKLLKHHNRWRRGADIPMLKPKTLTEVINTITEFYEKNQVAKN